MEVGVGVFGPESGVGGGGTLGGAGGCFRWCLGLRGSGVFSAKGGGGEGCKGSLNEGPVLRLKEPLFNVNGSGPECNPMAAGDDPSGTGRNVLRTGGESSF